MDFRDRKPDRNPMVFELLASGLGLRQTARVARMTSRNTEMKFRKISRHLRRLNANLRQPLPPGATLQFDEFETYEANRITRPLTLPLLIERDTRCILAARSAPIRPRGTKSPRRQRAIVEDEARLGRRPSRSRPAVYSVLRQGARLCDKLATVVLETDEKATYPELARRVFGQQRLAHTRTPGKLARTTANPLFPINHTEAMARDLNGRLRRPSWLASKRRWFLNLQLHLHAAYRNFMRRRFNHDRQPPAQRLGWIPKPLTPRHLLSWRQDWAQQSGHPLSPNARPIAACIAEEPGGDG
ncbi:MAG: hypothetical protein AAF628_33175 [Planctomycetota bacterium]